jgi:transposase InsO family protein
MNERRDFIEDWLQDQWSVSGLCAEYGISRKTGYKWIERFRVGGMENLADQPKDSRSHPNATPAEIVARIIELRQRHPFWGPRKLKKRLERLERGDWPSSSTIGGILKRHGLVRPRRKRARTALYEGPFIDELRPNDVWAADFKGWFKTRDGARIDPLTVSDCASRFLIRCRAVSRADGDNVQAQLTAAFREFGMPRALKTDNGVPFATVGLGGLSKLSVWLIKLGVTPQRIRPAHPEENGAHERMHRTLKQETAKPPQGDAGAQQLAFDRFRAEYNEDRPHEALSMKTPSDVYRASPRAFPRKVPDIEYPHGSVLRLVSTNGTIRFKEKAIYVSNALIDEYVRIEEADGRWDLSFGPVPLGQLDLKNEMVRRPKAIVLPMRPV